MKYNFTKFEARSNRTPGCDLVITDRVIRIYNLPRQFIGFYIDKKEKIVAIQFHDQAQKGDYRPTKNRSANSWSITSPKICTAVRETIGTGLFNFTKEDDYLMLTNKPSEGKDE